MNNVLYEPLPENWNGYSINWWFQVGIQIYLASEDPELANVERTEIIADLLFPEVVPPPEEMQECIAWFLNGWCHDRSTQEKEKKRLLDFNQDQWRIYADFRQIYGINLNEANLHWWEFMGMLWNMPQRQSSFLQVIEIRQKKITARMGKEEKEAIKKAQFVYGLDGGNDQQKREYTEEEKQKIDEVDLIRAKMKAKKQVQEEALAIFRK